MRFINYFGFTSFRTYEQILKIRKKRIRINEKLYRKKFCEESRLMTPQSIISTFPTGRKRLHKLVSKLHSYIFSLEMCDLGGFSQQFYFDKIPPQSIYLTAIANGLKFDSKYYI